MITLDIPAGSTIYDAALSACILAKDRDDKVSFVFNEITITVSPKSYHGDIVIIYCLKSELRRLKE